MAAALGVRADHRRRPASLQPHQDVQRRREARQPSPRCAHLAAGAVPAAALPSPLLCPHCCPAGSTCTPAAITERGRRRSSHQARTHSSPTGSVPAAAAAAAAEEACAQLLADGTPRGAASPTSIVAAAQQDMWKSAALTPAVRVLLVGGLWVSAPGDRAFLRALYGRCHRLGGQPCWPASHATALIENLQVQRRSAWLSQVQFTQA